MLRPRVIGYIKGCPVFEIRGASEPAPEPALEPPKTFTQEQVNALLAEQKRKAGEKFADYGDLKAKADQLDAITEQNKTEVQKATERATAAEQRATQAELKALRAEVAEAKKVPSSLLSGATLEDLQASADALLAFRGDVPPPPPATVKVVAPGGERIKTPGDEGRAEAARRFPKAQQQQ